MTATYVPDFTEKKELPIPHAPFYVIGKDTYFTRMFNDPHADKKFHGKSNYVVVPCQNEQQVQNATEVMESRDEFTHIQTVSEVPALSHRIYSLVQSWATLDVRFGKHD